MRSCKQEGSPIICLAGGCLRIAVHFSAITRPVLRSSWALCCGCLVGAASDVELYGRLLNYTAATNPSYIPRASALLKVGGPGCASAYAMHTERASRHVWAVKDAYTAQVK